MIVRDPVPDRVIRTYHIKKRGEERQGMSERQREQTLIVMKPAAPTNEDK